MENLQKRIKELGGNLPCERFCLSIYEIKERCEFSSVKSAELDKFIKKAVQHYNISTEGRRKKILEEYGPTLEECSNVNCIAPFILWEFGEHREFNEYLIQQDKAVDNFKWIRGISDKETAWKIWTSEKREDGLKHNDGFRLDYFKKHPNSRLK